jgi:hypothetical protein
MPDDPTNTKNPEVLLPARQDNYGSSRFNALRHGVLSRYTVLPSEDEHAYNTLLEALVSEHKPQGPTEEHLVEELAGAIWRKGRVRLGERASIQAALVRGAKGQDKQQNLADQEGLETARAMTEEAIRLIDEKSTSAYSQALAALEEGTREWWDEELSDEDYPEGEIPYRADSNSLKRFLENEALPFFKRQRELELAREQAFGEAIHPYPLLQLARYEVHLDRKFEKILAMLLKLQDLRRVAGPMMMSPAKTSNKSKRPK